MVSTNVSASRTDEPSTAGEPVLAVDGESDREVVTALGEAECRALLGAMDTPATAKELASDCDLSLSSVYRKLDRLAETPLVEQSTRPRLRGKHPAQYRRTVGYVLVDLTTHRPFGTDAASDADG